MIAARLAVAAVGLLAVAAGAQTTEAWQPPNLTTARYDEDWSRQMLRDDRLWRPTDVFKHVSLGSNTDDYLTTGLEIRARNEKYNGNLLDQPRAPDDGYLWLRALPYADLHIGRSRAFVQLVAGYAVGIEPAASPVDRTGIDVLQGFADVSIGVGNGAELVLRAGRELLPLGSERLIGTRYGPNIPLAFDGGRAIVKGGPLTLNLFYVRPVQPGLGNFDDRTSSSKALWGGYATILNPFIQSMGVDLYCLGYRNNRAVFDQGAGREIRHTIGTRFFIKGDVHWNIEAMVQFGRFANAPILAWSLGTEVGRRFESAPLKPNLTLRFNIISGDRHRDDRRLQTFNAMFPKGKYFGELSPIGPYNLVNVHPGVTFDLGHRVSFGVVGMAYWRQSTNDGIYDIPGRLLRSGRGSAARFIGKQGELTADWQVTPELDLTVSLSAFKPGAFIRETGPARTITLVGAEANFRF